MAPKAGSSSTPSPVNAPPCYNFNDEDMQSYATASCERAITAILEGKKYSSKSVPSYSSLVNKSVVESLSKYSLNFKYLVSTIVTENGDDGRPLQSVANVSAAWNADTDGVVTVQWQNDTMCVVTTVAGVMI